MVDDIMFYSQTFYSIFAKAYNLRRISNIFSEALIAFTEQSNKIFNNVCLFFLNIESKLLFYFNDKKETFKLISFHLF